MKSAPSYGVRSRRTAGNAGVRSTARTYGKARFGTYASKADGHITVDSDAERLVTHLLSIDPRVRSFKQQPFTVDLVGEQLLFEHKALTEVRRQRGGRRGFVEYTPDFSVVLANGLQRAYEVKLEGYEGDHLYWQKVSRASLIMEAHSYPLTTVVVPANPHHPLLINAQLLKQALMSSHTQIDPTLIKQVESFCAGGPVLQRDLCAALAIPTGLIPVLLVCGVLQADLTQQRICATMELSAAFGEIGHLCLIELLAVEIPSPAGVWP